MPRTPSRPSAASTATTGSRFPPPVHIADQDVASTAIRVRASSRPSMAPFTRSRPPAVSEDGDDDTADDDLPSWWTATSAPGHGARKNKKKKGKVDAFPWSYRVPAVPSGGWDPRALAARSPVRSSGTARATPASLAVPFRPDPPRCHVDLQRLTAVRSCSLGFAAPPATFSPHGVVPGVFRTPAIRSVSLPDWIPLLAFHPPSRISSAAPGPFPAPARKHRAWSGPLSLGVRRPFDALNPGDPPPGEARPTLRDGCSRRPRRPGSLRSAHTSPRRGVPRPLRSASAVSHDLDGLLPPGPGDLFQPLTPMGFVLPAPLLHRAFDVPKTAAARRAAALRRASPSRCLHRPAPRRVDPAWGVGSWTR